MKLIWQNIDLIIELSTKQIISRLLSIESRVDSSAIRTGVLDDKEWKNVKESADDISHAPFAVIDDCWDKDTKYRRNGQIFPTISLIIKHN